MLPWGIFLLAAVLMPFSYVVFRRGKEEVRHRQLWLVFFIVFNAFVLFCVIFGSLLNAMNRAELVEHFKQGRSDTVVGRLKFDGEHPHNKINIENVVLDNDSFGIWRDLGEFQALDSQCVSLRYFTDKFGGARALELQKVPESECEGR